MSQVVVANKKTTQHTSKYKHEHHNYAQILQGRRREYNKLTDYVTDVNKGIKSLVGISEMLDKNIQGFDINICEHEMNNTEKSLVTSLGINIHPLSIATTYRKNRIAVWNTTTVMVYEFGHETSTHEIPKPIVNEEFTNIKRRRGVMFTPTGKELLIIQDNCISIWKLNQRHSKIVVNYSLKGKILWHSFYCEDRPSEDDNYVEFNSNKLLLSVGWPQQKTIKIEFIKYEYSDISSKTTMVDDKSVVVTEVTTNSMCSSNEYSYKFRLHYIARYRCILFIQLTRRGICVNVYRVKEDDEEEGDDDEIVYKQKSRKLYDTVVTPELFGLSVPVDCGMLILSNPIHKLHRIKINKDGDSEMEDLIKFPPNIRQIQHISTEYERNFILVTANHSELYVYGKMNDDKYGIIYVTEVFSDITHSHLLPDLSKLVQISANELKIIDFSPYNRPFKFYYSTTIQGEVLSAKQHQLLIPLKYYHIIILRNKNIILENIRRKEYMILEDTLPLSTNVQMPSKYHIYEIVPNEKWLLYIIYYKPSIYKEYKGDDFKVIPDLPMMICYSVSIGVKSKLHKSLKYWFKIKPFDYISFNHASFIIKYQDMIKFYDITKVDTKKQPKHYKVELNSQYTHDIFMLETGSKFRKINFDVIGKSEYLFVWYYEVSKDLEIDVDYTAVNRSYNRTTTNIYNKRLQDERNRHTIQESLLTYQGDDIGDMYNAIDEYTMYKLLPEYDNVADDNDSLDDEQDDEVPFSVFSKNKKPKRTTVALFKLSIDHETLLDDSMGDETDDTIHPQTLDSFSINCMNNYQVSSKDGLFVVFFGMNGYEIVKKIEKNGVVRYESIRRRWRDKYKILDSKLVMFSPHGHFVVMAFIGANKTILFDLQNKHKITTHQLTHCKHLSDFPFYFTFFSDSVLNMNYLAVPDYQKEKGKVEVKVFDLEKKCFIVSAEFNPEMVPTYFELRHHHKDVLYLHVLLNKRSDIKNYLETGYHNCVLHIPSDKLLPLHEIIRTNTIKYFMSDTSEIKKFYLTLLINTYKTLKPYQIIQDVRLFSAIYMLNLSEGFEQIFSKSFDIKSLFWAYDIPSMVFSSETKHKEHSTKSISLLVESLVKDKQFPHIYNRSIESKLKDKHYRVLSSTEGSQSLFTNILFSPCHVFTKGNLKNHYVSLIQISDSDNQTSKLSKKFIEKKIKPLMLNDGKNKIPFEVYRTRHRLELTNGSKASIHLMQIIQSLPDVELKYRYRQLIKYKWNMIYIYSLIHVCVYYTMNILAYIHFCFARQHWIGIVVFTMNGLFLLFDWTCFASEFDISNRDPTNWIDIVVHAFSIFTISVLNLDVLNTSHDYLCMISIILITTRGIMLLKMFNSLRMLIMMMFQLMFELRWLPVVFFAVLLLAATSYKMAPDTPYDEEISLWEAIKEILFLVFISKKKVDEDNPVRVIVAMIGAAVLAQGTFYMIISVLLLTFQRIGEDRVAFELRSLILDIKDFDLVLQAYFRCTKKVKGYYLILVPLPISGDDPFEDRSKSGGAKAVYDNIIVEIAKSGMKQIGASTKFMMKDQDKKIDNMLKFMKKENVKVTKEKKKKGDKGKDDDDKKKKDKGIEIEGEVINASDITLDKKESRQSKDSDSKSIQKNKESRDSDSKSVQKNKDGKLQVPQPLVNITEVDEDTEVDNDFDYIFETSFDIVTKMKLDDKQFLDNMNKIKDMVKHITVCTNKLSKKQTIAITRRDRSKSRSKSRGHASNRSKSIEVDNSKGIVDKHISTVTNDNRRDIQLKKVTSDTTNK